MDEYQAWMNFVNTGRVQDYLLYNKYKKEFENPSQGDVKNEVSDKWIGSKGVLHR